MHPTSWLTIAALCMAIAGVALAAPRQDPPVKQDQPVNEYGAAVKAFRDRLDAYRELHEKAAGTVPKLKETEDPAKLTAREQAIGEAVRRARPDAKAGDVFGVELAAHFRTVIRKDWAKRSPADRAGLAEDMPSSAVADVNATYPSSLPLATFPATLLAQLPPLPDGLEYRFVGRHLILRDVEANIIVDVLRNVLPGGRT
jgi:hypothetical protein